MSSLVHCIYTSSQAHPMSTQEIDSLLHHSRESNARHGITGILFYAGGCFMQVLEGEAARIEELYSRIMVDPRHTRITRIILEAIPHRFFGEWSMALANLGVAEIAGILDAGPVAREDLLAEIDEGRAKKLLRAFSEGRWRKSVTLDAAGHQESSLGTAAGHVSA